MVLLCLRPFPTPTLPFAALSPAPVPAPTAAVTGGLRPRVLPSHHAVTRWRQTRDASTQPASVDPLARAQLWYKKPPTLRRIIRLS